MTTSKRIHLGLLCLVFLCACLFTVYWAAVWLSRGDILPALVALGATLFCLDLGFHMTYVAVDAAVPRTNYGPEGTVIRPQRYVDLMFGVSSLASALAAALCLAMAAFGADVDAVPATAQRGALSLSPFLLLFGGWGFYGMLKHRGGESYLRLTPHGFESWNGHWCSFQQNSWDEVEQILDHVPKRKRIRRGMVVFALPEDRYAMEITDTMTHDSDALRDWVRFYWQHPDHRGELVDERALRRLEERQFTVG